MSEPEPPPRAAPTGELDRAGLLHGLGAYLWWGLLPLYFPLLVPAGALEISAHRVLWSLVLCVVLLAATRGLPALRALLRDRRTSLRLGVAALLLAVNWVAFLVGVLTGRVLDASLGYFINPIVTVLLGVVVLGERLRPAQWLAVGIAAGGVVVIGIGYGSVPWIALILASSFGLYGLAKKQLGRGVAALPGFAVETVALAPLAAGYLGWLALRSEGTFLADAGGGGLGVGWHDAALMVSGIATAVPLLFFAAAARRLPLATMGTMQFVVAVVVFGEQMVLTRWVGFVLVWVALVVLTVDGYRVLRDNPRSPGARGA